MSIPFILSTDFITVVSENKPFTVYANDGRFVKLKEAIKAKNWSLVPEIISLPKAIAVFSAGKVQVFDGEVTYNGKAIHSCLTARILEFVKEGFPFEPLVHFMDKLMENPSERSREQVYQFMEANKLPIEENGDVIFFKVVTKDLKDCHTNTIDNSIGQVVKMDRNLVDDDPNSACSRGLHCASWAYCESFGGPDSIVVLVRVNPKNIVSVPADHNASKVRVCEYEVVKVVGEKESVADFNSNHAAANDIYNGVKKDSIKKVKDSEQSKYIGADKAFKLYREGQDVISGIFGTILANSDKKYSRSFFRQYDDWQLA